MRVFKTKWFARYARKNGIDDNALIETVREAEGGLIECDYGGGLVKQRIPRDGAGKSGGYRGVLAYRSETRSVFLYCFAKSKLDNIKKSDVEAFKLIAAKFLGFSDTEIATAIENEEIEEVEYNAKKI